jgi:hypothetical protein
MATKRLHEVVDVQLEEGELSFEARLDGRATSIRMGVDTPGPLSAEAVLPACLMPAMRFGGRLALPVPVSPMVLRNQREFQAVQRAWSRGWEFDQPPLVEVEVAAPVEGPEMRPGARGRVAAFFSGGVDSWSVVLGEPELTDLIFVKGFDLRPGVADHAALATETEARLREAAAELELGFHVVDTNLRALSDPLIDWNVYCGAALDAIALFLAPRFERVRLAGDTDYETQVPSGISRLVDQLWSSERLEIVQAGGRKNRIERLRAIADHALVQQTLRVCWENPGAAYNCGRCRKCLVTMIALEALGVRDSFATFPTELDLGPLADAELAMKIQVALWQDTLDAVRAAGRADLEPAVARMVATGKDALGLPETYRSRATPPPSPPAFFATRETAKALAGARAAAFLVGGYDGSGNYGDMVQLDATLDLLRRHDPGLLALPVLERAHLASHRELRGEFMHPFEHALFYGPSESHTDDLVPVLPPHSLSFTALYLYGGGYVNPAWGPRKLAMLRAAEQLVATHGPTPTCRISSGLQADAGWIAELGAEETETLRGLELLGGRDRGSVEPLAALGSSAQVLDSGDDAIGVLGELPLDPIEPSAGALRVNVHFAEHEWVAGRPGERAAGFAERAASLGRHAGRPVVVQPLIAYLDRRVDERPGVERLEAACAERAAPVIRQASLTLSCSYHVALTSLMLGVPAELAAENEYYRQKAAGLATAEKMRERRAAAEEELLSRLAATRESIEHEVGDVEHGGGELSFTARIGGDEQRVWMRADPAQPTSAGAVLPACLMPAMRFGGRLSLPVSISPRVLRGQREFQGIQRAWSREWEFGRPPLAEVEVNAATALPEDRVEARGRVAAFFSGGVDSWSVVLDEPELTDVIFVRGFDLLSGNPLQTDLVGEVESRLRGAADELGLGFHVVETNLRELTDPHIGWEAAHGCAADAVAHFLAPRFERVLSAGANDYENQAPMGVSRLVDRLWSSERLELVEAGGRYSRVERVRRIAAHPLVRRTLRVCWQNRDGAYNCGRCRKCLYTMAALEAVGARDAVETFPPELDVELLAAAEINHRSELFLFEDLLDAIRAAGRADLAPPVARLVARGKRKLGLPLSYRSRATPGPPPLRGYAPRAATAARGRR